MSDRQGSTWHRWDPHIHAPGTILNNQYKGSDAWNEFLSSIEQSAPQIGALGITDYLSIDIYEKVVAEKRSGRLANVGLLFPNVELRFSIGTTTNSAINFHLLICPDDSNHVAYTRRLLLGLDFVYHGEHYRCERSDLIRLGRAFNSAATEDHVALREGTNQFKVSHDQLRDLLSGSPWAEDNVLIAVAGGSRDGTSGLQENTAFSALRQELERSAHIIFSSQPKQRQFWLGKGSIGLEDLVARYRGPKPCLHGSDAHDQATVGAPAERRFCWIKGDLTFESLRQACLEPENRSYIGSEPPRHAMPSQVISRLNVSNAPWLVNPIVPLNPGLVAIIGARGSGKTALADLIAAGAYALSKQLNDRSFVQRAANLIGNAKAALVWEDGHITENEIEHVDVEELFYDPYVQYLSQQFVDQLCSSEGLTDSLVEEVQRVVFQAHPPEGRMGATSFAELLELRTASLRNTRFQEEAVISLASDDLVLEQAKKDSLAGLRMQRQATLDRITKDKRDRQSLVGPGQAERSRQLELVSDALGKVRQQVDAWTRRHQTLLALRNEVSAMQQTGAATILQRWKDKYPEAGLDSDEWQAFLVRFSPDAESILEKSINGAIESMAAWRGPAKNEVTPPANAPPQVTSLVHSGVDLAQQTSTLLSAEVNRLRGLIGIDQENLRKYNQLSEKISKEEVSLAKLDRDIEAADRAGARIVALQQARSDAYQNVFQAVIDEERELSELYGPLQEILTAEAGALGKLTFSVRRIVDVESWAKDGERLFDLRSGPFRGKGSLVQAIEEKGLKGAWEVGLAEDVVAAMRAFREEYGPRLMEHCPPDRQTRGERREWGALVSSWLYGTKHISVSYGVRYDGVDIEQLSPGTRGIVLLLLYLSIDTEDDRPLIIDQPEENLDPKSIFVELVGRFKTAKHRRQIIIVTHNANLVVNADADQVIVATAGSHRPGQLPLIEYMSGGLENPHIRQQVCEILEGGESAFKERARRLRISISKH